VTVINCTRSGKIEPLLPPAGGIEALPGRQEVIIGQGWNADGTRIPWEAWLPDGVAAGEDTARAFGLTSPRGVVIDPIPLTIQQRIDHILAKAERGIVGSEFAAAWTVTSLPVAILR
jgi:hypothetical protein